MAAKQDRLDIIKDIISQGGISSQDDLKQALSKKGYNFTQATLSRDLKQLKVVKGKAHDGSSEYMLPENPSYQRVREHHAAGTAVQNGFMHIRYTGNLAVIKTRPGYASGLALDIDNAHFSEVIGTIAGDDTIMMALEEGFDKELLEANLRTIIPVYPGTRF
ncbi:MAG: arginine repressor [Bacteroidaceae bacterium]|jgi:transcriptional regulator of arginine metabolism|nr:arginine repressor [Bacteroidaceae bacterium]